MVTTKQRQLLLDNVDLVGEYITRPLFAMPVLYPLGASYCGAFLTSEGNAFHAARTTNRPIGGIEKCLASSYLSPSLLGTGGLSEGSECGRLDTRDMALT